MKGAGQKLLVVLLAALLVTGCSSRSTRSDDAQGRATVEDRSMGQTGTDADGGAQSSALPGGSDLSASALNDPASPLAVRIIYFDYDSANIRSDSSDTLAAHAAFLAANPTLSVTLEGHADERGSARVQPRCWASAARWPSAASSSCSAPPAGQVRSVSYGEERPAVDGHGEESYSLNRRVELVY